MDAFETRLAGVLRADAERAVVPIDALAIADAAARTPARGLGRMPLLAPAFAAVLVGGGLLAGAWLLGGAPRLDLLQPSPVVPEPQQSPAATTAPASVLTAIVLRATPGSPDSVDVVALRPAGEERVLRTLAAADLPGGGVPQPGGDVNEHGMLAVWVDPDRWALLSLADPDRPPVMVDYGPVIGGRWSSDGLFATTVAADRRCCHIQVVRPDGASSDLGYLQLPGSGPDIVWAADGSGLLVVDERWTSNAGLDIVGYGIHPVDGGAVRPSIPQLSFRGPRYVAAGGQTLSWCFAECAQPSVRVSTYQAGDGSFSGGEWLPGDRPLPGRLADAGFASDDRTLWLLFDRVDGSRRYAVLVRADEPERLTEVASFEIDPGTTRVWFEGFAPDDSAIAIGHWTSFPDGAQWTLLAPATGATTTTQDPVVGWVADPLD